MTSQILLFAITSLLSSQQGLANDRPVVAPIVSSQDLVEKLIFNEEGFFAQEEDVSNLCRVSVGNNVERCPSGFTPVIPLEDTIQPAAFALSQLQRRNLRLDRSGGAKDLFDLALETKVGKLLMGEFLERFNKGEIRIRTIQSARRLSEAQRIEAGMSAAIGSGTAAAFDAFSDPPTIYIDTDLELGVLVPEFLHEVHHALNQERIIAGKAAGEELREIHRIIRNDSTYAARLAQIVCEEEQRTLDDERTAYMVQMSAAQDILNQASCYRPLVRAVRPDNLAFFNRVCDDTIIRDYGLREGCNLEKRQISGCI